MAIDAGWKPDHDEIIAATVHNIDKCAKIPFYANIRGFRFSPKSLPDDVFIWVKYGHILESMRYEANTQHYVHDELLKMGGEVRQRFYVPKLFDYFEARLDVMLYLMTETCQLRYGIIVMEYVTGTSVRHILRDLQLEYTEQAGKMRGEERQAGGVDQCESRADAPCEDDPEGSPENSQEHEDLDRSDVQQHVVENVGGCDDEAAGSPTRSEEQSEATPGGHPSDDDDDKAPSPAEKALQEKIVFFKNKVADAMSFLLTIPAPPDVTPGPVGGGYIMHWAFGRDDCFAPKKFATLKELEDFVNGKITKTWPDITPAKFMHEGLKLCYCDLNLDNFLLEDADDPSGSVVIIIDFEHAGFLPHSFMTWEMWDKREFDIEERVRARSGLELSGDNVFALHALLRTLTWEWQR